MITQWYTDEHGNMLNDHIRALTRFEDPKYNEKRWSEFYARNAIKFEAWAYEKEQLIILSSGLDQYSKKENRKLAYVFHSLKGIIFGMHTSREDKIEMIYKIE